MTDVFISYSRKDTDFVQVLHQALKESHYNAWVDWEDIPLTSDWWAEIEAGIEAANTFIFVISPDSAVSKVCRQEIDHAVANHKRLVPIVHREGFDHGQLHTSLNRHNWLFFRSEDDFAQTFQTLVETLNTDLHYVKTHTRLIVRAMEWERKGRSDDLLLRGEDLIAAETWLTQAMDSLQHPLPTEQQKNYIQKSREVEDAHQRLVAMGNRARKQVRFGAVFLGISLAVSAAVSIIAAHRYRQVTHLRTELLNISLESSADDIHKTLHEDVLEVAQDINTINGETFAQGDLNVVNGSRGEYHIARQIRDNTNVQAAYCGSETGSFFGILREPSGELVLSISNPDTDFKRYTYSLDENNNRLNLLSIVDYDSRQRPWYQSAMAAQGPVWLPEFMSSKIQSLTATASQPVYNHGDAPQPLGVCSTDFTIPQDFHEFMKTFDLAEVGQAFVVNGQEALIASSGDDAVLQGQGDTLAPLMAANSANPLIRQTAIEFENWLRSQADTPDSESEQSSVFTFTQGRKTYQVHVTPSEYMDWWVVVVMATDI